MVLRFLALAAIMKIPFEAHDGRLHCRPCNAYKIRTDFYPSDIKRKHHKCRGCANRQRLALVQSSTEARLLNRITRREHRHGNNGHGLERCDIRAILKHAQHRSQLSGSHRDITIVRRDQSQPITPTNALVLTVAEAIKRRRQTTYAETQCAAL